MYRADEYVIVTPDPKHAPAMTEVHARAFESAYTGLSVSNTPERIERFVYNVSPTGFYTRMLRQWSSLVANQQPDPNARYIVFVALETATDTVVGLGAGKRSLLPRYYSYEAPVIENAKTLIAALYVDPKHHRKGIGSALLRALMQRMGPEVDVETTSNTPAVDFYKKHGFKERLSWASGMVAGPARHGVELSRLAMSCTFNPYYDYRDYRSPLTVVSPEMH